MRDGMGEGLCIVSPSEGPDCRISKWKIGAEFNKSNIDSIASFMGHADENGLYFENNSKQAMELFEKMLVV